MGLAQLLVQVGVQNVKQQIAVLDAHHAGEDGVYWCFSWLV